MPSSLHALNRPAKLLITSALAILSAGVLVSELLVAQSLEMADGRVGLSLEDVTSTFHGDRSTSPLKRQALGPMKRYFSAVEDPRRLSQAEQADLDRLVAWSETGASEAEYWDLQDKRKKPGPVYLLLERHRCLDCHAPTATTIGHKKDSPLNTYAAILRFTQPDTGMDRRRLLMLSHVHLFGMGLVLLLVGAALVLTRFSVGLRSSLIVSGQLALLIMVGGWWGVKLWGAPFTGIVVLSGAAIPLTLGLGVGLCLYDLWLRPSQTAPPPAS